MRKSIKLKKISVLIITCIFLNLSYVKANTIQDNQAPTDIFLSNNSIRENESIGATVGTLTTTDPDAGDTFTYSIVGGDFSSFAISGNTLRTNDSFNYEKKNSYSIIVRATDSRGLFTDKVFTIFIQDQIGNEAPSITSGIYHFQSIPLYSVIATVPVSAIATLADDDIGALSGIAVTNVSPEGIWQYQLPGGDWIEFGEISPNNALLLPSNAYVSYFSTNSGTFDFTFRGWDQTTGTAGGKADTTINGGTTAFSSNTQTAKIEIFSISTVSIKSQPTKLTYLEGENLDLSGLVLTGKNSDNSYLEVISEHFSKNRIIVSPANGSMLNLSNHNQQISIMIDGKEVKTEPLTVIRVIKPITAATITGLVAPRTGETPLGKEALSTYESNFIIDDIRWLNLDESPATLTDTGKFKAGTRYSAKIRLQAKEGYKFIVNTTTTVNGETISSATVDGGDVEQNTLDVMVTFNQTADLAVNTATITSQPSNLVYQEGESLNLNGLVVTLLYNDGTSKDVAVNDFTTNGMTVSPAEGTTLNVANHHNKPITITINNQNINTNHLTINALTYAETPVIKVQPENKVVNVGEIAQIFVEGASSKGVISYQWYRNTTNSNDGGTLIPNATTASYTPPTNTSGTTYYYAVITNTDNDATGNKTATATSQVAVVTVKYNAETPVITTQPTDQTVSVGEGIVPLKVVATTNHGTLSYQWYKNTMNNTNGIPIPGATGTTYTPPTDTAGTTYYYVVVTNTDNSATGQQTATITSNVVAVNVKNTNANLSALTLSTGTLNPVFDKNTAAYTVNVPNSVSSITVTPTVEDTGKATVTVNGQPSSATVSLNVGSNTITVVVTAENGTTKTYTITVQRAQSSSGGGGGSTPTPQPGPEIITVPVETGNPQQGSTVSTAIIKRTTDANGNKKDEVELTPQNAAETVQKLKETGADTARIVIPDTKDEVSEINFSVKKDSIKALQDGDINLEIYTDNARIAIPKDSMGELKDDLYFRIVPIKEEQRKNEVKERAKQEEVVQKVAGSININIVGRPMTIETNMPNTPVDLILPLKDVTIPENASERAEFFNKLGVFIEHSDGEKVFIKGEVVPYKNGELGLKFTINKFSTFTIINMENGWKTPNYNDQFTGRTSEIEQPVMADKVWNITFNQTIKNNTVNEDTVYMYDEDGEKVEIDVQLTNNRTITVSPKSYYKPDTKYYLYLSKDIESSNGVPLKESERYVFKTTPYSLDKGKWQEKADVSPNKEWTITFNANVKESLLIDNYIFVTDQHGRKVQVNTELVNPKTVKIKPVKPYDYGQTYYLFMKDLKSDSDITMKEQTWMKYTIESGNVRNNTQYIINP
ncbi:Ig-like domain-containing protein [Ureibacillus xyleni]|uniref:Ig-like domain-containing protein n=1 Tax=Ureibacillus xyleni TaxID=614648 RepID=A0A285TBL5_9BACL|nr:cadherin-like beta sandwich domain-containing protein [Ureibacillus xyleni]SOC19479.1 Ig-like domain-containing protein [Ureibacillus xyleni]